MGEIIHWIYAPFVASLMMRCVPNNVRYDYMNALYKLQKTWVIRDQSKTRSELYKIMQSGGMKIEEFDACLSNINLENEMDTTSISTLDIPSIKNNKTKIFSNRKSEALNDVIKQRMNGNKNIIGVMIESNLNEGKQSLKFGCKNDLKKGVSITDSCISFETTERIIMNAYNAL